MITIMIVIVIIIIIIIIIIIKIIPLINEFRYITFTDLLIWGCKDIYYDQRCPI